MNLPDGRPMDAAADHASPDYYGNWKAPSADGELLIWPAPEELLADTLGNGSRLRSASHVLIQNVPLPEIRRRCANSSATATKPPRCWPPDTRPSCTTPASG